MLPRSIIFLIANLALSLASTRLSFDTHDYYVIQHDPNGAAPLHECAEQLGVQVVRQVGELANHWVVSIPRPRVDRRSGRDRVLETFKQLRLQAAMGNHSRRSQEALVARRVVSSLKMLERQSLRKRVKRDISALPRQAALPTQGAPNGPAVAYATSIGLKDPLFPKQWHIVNDQNPQHMMNITGVWALGVTGKGVTSAMVDDGLDFDSDDLAANFDAKGSYDFNDHVPLPKPVLWDDHHGTRCAGEIAAVKNDVCGIGLAYDSKVSGIRILSGAISDIDEAAALNYGYQTTQLYSCSWGPPDDGRSMEGPSLLIQKAVLNGINKGRGGLGSVFVFASGNGASSGDQCNFDGYTNSIYSVTVGAVDFKGLHPYYSEACAANMIVTYSSGSGDHIHTTDVGKNKCSDGHGGTSAAAPLAVGIFALALSVRPDLTWRDIQYLCVLTGIQINPEDPDWDMAYNKRPYSYKYGWGVLNGYHYLEAAKNWKLVKPQAWAHSPTVHLTDAVVNELTETMMGGEPVTKAGITSNITITKRFLKDNNFARIEHVNVRVWIAHTKRGDVEVEITSPTGVKSVLGAPRRFDSASTGYPGWMFMSVKHWGEPGDGVWTIRVSDQADPHHSGKFLGWNLMLWGECIDASKAKPYELPDKEEPFDDPTVTMTPVPSSTKVLVKPTHNLPPDHGTADGEADKPAFHNGSSSTPTPTPFPANPADEGYFTHITDLVGSNRWLFGAFGIVALFGVGSGLFLWRRRRQARQRRSGDYSALPGDAVPMGSLERGSVSGPRSKELYDAFGEVSDEEDDENAGLVRRTEDESIRPYRDAPESPEGPTTTTAASSSTATVVPSQQQQQHRDDGSVSSTDGSWVDAR